VRKAMLYGMAAVCAVGCAAPPARLHVGPLDGDVAGWIATHPLAPDAGIRADRLVRLDGTSHHLVQVRTQETPHRHATHDLQVLVLRGGGTLHLGDATIALRAGDVAIVPRGTAHWFVADGREVAVALVAFSPPLDAPDQEPVTP